MPPVSETGTPSAASWPQRLGRIAPGLPALLAYRRADFSHDLVAGLSVAAVALPVGVAYAQLAGFNPAKVEGLPGWHSIARHEGAGTVPGVLLFRFNAPIVFFNAPHFKREAMAAAEAAGPALKWFVIDMIPITMIDATGLYAANEVVSTLKARGVVFAAAGRMTEWDRWAESRHLKADTGEFRRFPSLDAAIEVYRQEAHGSADPAAT